MLCSIRISCIGCLMNSSHGGQVIGYDRRQPVASAIKLVNLSDLDRHSEWLHQVDPVSSATLAHLVYITGP